jgi:hypothetical protein
VLYHIGADQMQLKHFTTLSANHRNAQTPCRQAPPESKQASI